MPRKTREDVSQIASAAGTTEHVADGDANASYVNGIAASTFADEEYPRRETLEFDAPDLGAATDSEPTKRRGRKKGYKLGPRKPKPEASTVNLAIDKLTQGVAFIHCTLANVLRVEELAMGVEEAGTVVTATVDVLAQYDLTPDPKTAAWLNLTMVLATVYGTRAMAYNHRTKTKVVAIEEPTQ